MTIPTDTALSPLDAHHGKHVTDHPRAEFTWTLGHMTAVDIHDLSTRRDIEAFSTLRLKLGGMESYDEPRAPRLLALQMIRNNESARMEGVLQR
jgi:hypothetical protein